MTKDEIANCTALIKILKVDTEISQAKKQEALKALNKELNNIQKCKPFIADNTSAMNCICCGKGRHLH